MEISRTPRSRPRGRTHGNGYLDDYDVTARAAFDVQFQRDLDALEENTLKPLAGALAVWLRQESMRAVFQCNFDAQIRIAATATSAWRGR